MGQECSELRGVCVMWATLVRSWITKIVPLEPAEMPRLRLPRAGSLANVQVAGQTCRLAH